MLSEIRRIEPNLFKLFKKDDVTLQLLDKTPDLSHDEHDDGFSNVQIIPTNVDSLSDDENDENAAREWPHNISTTSSTSLLIEQGDTSTGSVEHPSPAIISNIFPQQRHKAVSSTPTLTHIDRTDKPKHQRNNRYTTINTNDPLYAYAGQILCALHVIYEVRFNRNIIRINSFRILGFNIEPYKRLYTITRTFISFSLVNIKSEFHFILNIR